jgi:L-2,4-diaminobutyric acid acetyltransferase
MDIPLSSICLAIPTSQDAAEVAGFIRACPPLESNTTYAYALLCTHFAQTCVVARDDVGIVGFAAAYLPPIHPDTLFVWQIGVHNRARGMGLGISMLETLIGRVESDGVRYLEATVSPSNSASRGLFRRVATERGVPCEVSPYFGEDLLGGAGLLRNESIQGENRACHTKR